MRSRIPPRRQLIRTADLLPLLAALAIVAAALGAALAETPASSDSSGVRDDEETSAETATERGWHHLRTRPYLPPDFDMETFDRLWTMWPEPDRSRAEQATPAERHRMIRDWYGLPHDPQNPEATGPGMGWINQKDGSQVMNCLACHGGTVAGQTVPGLPNSRIDLQLLVSHTRLLKIVRGKKLSHLELGALKLPLGTTAGTTNAVIFGVILEAVRDEDMRFDPSRPVPKLLHHDMDAPPFWNVKYKSSLYCDGFAPKNHRMLMQFILVKQNTADRVRELEPEFRDLLAWIESLEPPKYPFPVDEPLARAGQKLFTAHCARCHGTYGPQGAWEQHIVPLETIGTDPVRLQSLARPHREWVSRSWMSRYGKDPVETDPGGYLAPPLHGIWASAPYLHNGSVPTLWHLLHPAERPVIWQRPPEDTGRVEDYNQEQVGLKFTAHDGLPEDSLTPRARRRLFDTRQRGKSAAGHDFPDVLNEQEKRAVLEYLKTL